MTAHPIHIQVAGILALKEGPEEARELLAHASPEAQKTLAAVLEHFDSETAEQQLKALCAQESFSGIAEIHPAWLVEALKKESPRVIGVILRHLPSKHVRYLLEHLPKRTVMQLPKLI
ncbi:MAG: hypothetical protein U1D33_02090, partial [bacterium]|nr:hypothetical protein [bacterium]